MAMVVVPPPLSSQKNEIVRGNWYTLSCARNKASDDTPGLYASTSTNDPLWIQNQ